MEQHKCECWNNETTYNANVFQGEGRKRVSGKAGLAKHAHTGAQRLDLCYPGNPIDIYA